MLPKDVAQRVTGAAAILLGAADDLDAAEAEAARVCRRNGEALLDLAEWLHQRQTAATTVAGSEARP